MVTEHITHTVTTDHIGVLIAALVYLVYGLWFFLVARDVVRIRAQVSEPVSLAWILSALFLPAVVVWMIHRRDLLRRESSRLGTVNSIGTLST